MPGGSGKDPDVVVTIEAFEGGGIGGEDLEGGGGRAAGLARSVGAVGEGGADVADGGEGHPEVMVARRLSAWSA